ncbi:MAG TPA: hypothetical protein PK836_03380 [Syntrophales bacterium]|nr:hypothetical protein [Syntrophales bacterium]HOM06594.1 hypothetical protein [Syntrophales bacterium]HON99623.1 hypothetical protein [Syntrophales bacterium]HPC00706.1 hypothetical protein [Syntrophales bacterium]HPQ06144.1 hypothetical protein [Syntrophales bacterium]
MTVCACCGSPKVFALCADCRRPLCERCARFELLAEGCGTVIPTYFCPACVSNPLVNPNAVFWAMKEKDGPSDKGPSTS